MIDFQTFLYLAQESYVVSAGLLLWLVSAFHATFRVIQQWKLTSGTVHARAHVANHMFILFLYSVAQWTVLITTLSHLGVPHGWEIHLIEENQGVAFFVFGIANIHLLNHLLSEVEEFYEEEK